MNRLVTRQLKKRYRKTAVVNGVDLEVRAGEVVGLLGPNGAGKTTCFYMIVGLIKGDGGEILLDGKDISEMAMHHRARLGIGYLPQEASIFRKLTVGENIMAILEAQPHQSPKERGHRLEQLLEEFHIGHKRDALGISLSGGERRRVEIARALAVDPLFILLDEPFAGIDPISVVDIQKIIEHLKNSGIGVLITDHNVRETLGICDRAYILSEGTVLTQGTAEEILRHPDVRDIYLGADFKL